jgi:phospholipid/cholesterol/gamma-HCH transport system substrate-binding protein
MRRRRPANDRSSVLGRQRSLGVAVVVIGALLLYVAFSGSLPFLGSSGGRTLTARFAEANEVDDSTPVRVGGVDVGTVLSLRAAPDDTTTVVMRITSHGVSLHSDAGAEIRWRTLLGGSMYIDLNPGSPDAPPLHGEIPLSRTGAQVDWDEFNDQMPTATRGHFREMLGGFDAGLSAPRSEQRTLAVLGPDVSTIGRAADALRGEQIGDLPSLIRGSAITLRALADSTSSLRQLIDAGDATLAVTANHNSELAQAIVLSPPALRSTMTTSKRLNGMLTALDPLVSRLEPGARELGAVTRVLGPMLTRTDRLLRDARPLLAVAPNALRALGAMSQIGVPLIAGLRPTLNRLNAQLLPLLDARSSDTRLRLYETLGPMASSLSASLAGFDANTALYNFNVQFATGSLLLPCDQGANSSQLAECLVSTHSASAATRHEERRR